MSLNNSINNINMSIISRKQQEQKEAEAKKMLIDLKANFKSFLRDNIIEALECKSNIYIDDVKSYLIDKTITQYKKTLSVDGVQRFNAKYNDNILIFLNDIYYTTCKQAEQIHKKQTPQNQDDYKKQIAIDKWNLQRERERVKLAIEREKLQQLQQKQIQKQYKPVQTRQPQRYYTPIRSGSGGEVAKVLIYIIFAPVAIFWLIIYGFISAAAKTK